MGLALLCPDAQSLPLAGTDAKAQPLAGNAASHIRIRQLVQPTSSASGAAFQGRFKSELIEDESYFWTVSRYIHLNPVRGKRPLADHRATGPGRSIRATTAGGGALDGWPTRLCIRPGVASRAATISRGGLPAVRRAGTGEGSGKPLSVRGAWLAAWAADPIERKPLSGDGRKG